MEDDLFHVGRGVGQHGGAADLQAGAGGRRHGDAWRDGGGIGARPPIADILEVPHRTPLARHERDQLADIETRAAAERDHTVMSAGPVGGDAGGEVLLARVRIDVGEHRPAQPGRIQEIEHPGRDRQRRQPAIRHQQGPRDAGYSTRFAELADATGAEPDGRRIAPVGRQRHALGPDTTR